MAATPDATHQHTPTAAESHDKTPVSTASENVGTSSIEDALAAMKQGAFVVVMDNEDRENEGDLIMIAEFATEKSLAFMIRYSSGVICAPLLGARLDALQLPLMVPNNSEVRQCKFTVTVDLKEGNSTGISAADLARTIRALADPNVPAAAFSRPGHIFPLLAIDAGVVGRAGHTEAAVDLARLAGASPAAYICEINDDNGRMMRRPALQQFAVTHGLHLITISDLIRYRFAHETLLRRTGNPRRLVSPFGSFETIHYEGIQDPRTQQYDALVFGTVSGEEDVLFHFVDSSVDGSVHAQWAQQTIAAARRGVLVYGAGFEALVNVSGELMARQSMFGMGIQILRDLGVRSSRLLAVRSPQFDTRGFGLPVHDVQLMNIKFA